MSVKKAIEKIGPKAKVVSGAASAIDTPTDAGQLTGKVGLVTGGSNKVGLQVGIKLADKFRKSNSRIYLTTRYADTIPGLEKALAKECNYDEEIMSRIKFAQLDLLDRGSLFKLYRQIKDEAMSLDILVNNARKFELPSQGSEERFKVQCERALAVNYEGMKRICKTFTPMLNHAGRIVLCSSYLGHLSNIDGNEPAASKLRKRFAAKDLTEEKLDRLIKEFEDNVYGGGSGRWIQNGWPSCPFTVSKIAVNAYSRILQDRLDKYHEQKKLVVNAVHHGCNHRKMNVGHSFPEDEAGEFVANMATLTEDTHIKGKILWKGTETFDNWDYGGLDDNKQSKPFCAIYDMEKDAEKMQDTNTGFCLTG